MVQWLGEAEKSIKAVFTLASKIAPTVIFIDEVDSLLGQRGLGGEHETGRKVRAIRIAPVEVCASWRGQSASI